MTPEVSCVFNFSFISNIIFSHLIIIPHLSSSACPEVSVANNNNTQKSYKDRKKEGKK